MTASPERRTFGRTGLDVTALGYGAMEIRGRRIWSGHDLTDDQADCILDAGINFIDTAYDYGRSEEYIGRFLAYRRNDYYLATKRGCTAVNAGEHAETPYVWTRENLQHNIDTSLPHIWTLWISGSSTIAPSIREKPVSCFYVP